MAPKRASGVRSPGSSGKKQQTIMGSFQASKPKLAPTEVIASMPELSVEHTSELEQAVDAYCLSWAEKCGQKSNYHDGINREDVDLDSRGLHLVRAFVDAAQLASSRDQTVSNGKFLDKLVLVMRNDVVHQSSHVSRAAHAALMSYLSAFPYAQVKRYPTEGSAPGQPYLLINPAVVWIPLESDRQSFTSKYLLGPDMTIAGQTWQKGGGTSTTSRRFKGSSWASPLHLIVHCMEMGERAATMDFNGDLQLLDYLLAVMEEDLDGRLLVHQGLGSITNGAGGSSSRAKEADEIAGRKRALLENSLTWRIVAGSYAEPEVHQKLIRSIVHLIVGGGNAPGFDSGDGNSSEEEDAGLNAAEEEPDDDAPAGISVFTSRELASMASRVLNLMLKLYGAAESAKAFLSTGRHRSSSVNYRMALDSHLLSVMWGTGGPASRRPHTLKKLLRALTPRDALRLLGLLAARKFSQTYDASSVTKYGIREDVSTSLFEAHSMISRGSDLNSFFEVEAVPMLASLHCGPSRAARAYGSINHVAAVISGIAVAVATRVALGEDLASGPGGMEALKFELAAAIKATAELSKGGAGGVAHRLSTLGMNELAIAQMALVSLP